MARHWDDPKFRQNLLNRVAPPGPNGYPDPELAEDFIKLYQDAVLNRGSVAQDVPDKEAQEPRGPHAHAAARWRDVDHGRER